MRRREYELEKRIPELLGPMPGPEELVLDQIDDSHFGWHLEHQGRLIPPNKASSAWQAYMDEALCRLGRTPGMGVAMPAGQKHRI